jgi:transcriptional regulator with XRE-family HTH domain
MRKFETADRIRELMQEKQWKQVDIINNSKPFQEELGVKLGKSALSQYVNGVQAPDQKKLALLALTFNVSEAWLMGYDVPRERDTSSTTTTAGYTETDLRKMAENAKTFDGKPLNENDIQAIQNIIEIYLQGRL